MQHIKLHNLIQHIRNLRKYNSNRNYKITLKKLTYVIYINWNITFLNTNFTKIMPCIKLHNKVIENKRRNRKVLAKNWSDSSHQWRI